MPEKVKQKQRILIMRAEDVEVKKVVKLRRESYQDDFRQWVEEGKNPYGLDRREVLAIMEAIEDHEGAQVDEETFNSLQSISVMLVSEMIEDYTYTPRFTLIMPGYQYRFGWYAFDRGI
ncbi:MAG: hypothetical protein WCT26_03335 [Candidatus Buchananbacteria bacterium]|jgi:hypothetical protein